MPKKKMKLYGGPAIRWSRLVAWMMVCALMGASAFWMITATAEKTKVLFAEDYTVTRIVDNEPTVKEEVATKAGQAEMPSPDGEALPPANMVAPTPETAENALTYEAVPLVNLTMPAPETAENNPQTTTVESSEESTEITEKVADEADWVELPAENMQKSAELVETAEEITEETTEVAAEEATEETAAAIPYTEGDLLLFAQLIYAEGGCEWYPDWVQLYIGSVVLNRLSSPEYPDTLYGVIFQRDQYGPTVDGRINNHPDARTVRNARWLLENGSQLPAGVLGQREKPLGPVYDVYYDTILDESIYFFYL